MFLRRKMLKLLLGVSLCVFTLSCLVTADDKGDSAFLLYCEDDIRNFSLASGTHSLLMSDIDRPRVVDYYIKDKVFFWTDFNDRIHRAQQWQEGARPPVFRSGVDSHGLAVDWIHNLVYWTEYYNGEIGVSRLDGSIMRTVLKEEGIKPSDIALNPAEGFMFWSDSGVTRKIERCNMDGTNRMVIVKEDISWVNGMAIDLDSQRVLWVDGGKNSLSSAKFDGNHRRNLITQLKTPNSIDVYGQHVYFVTRGSGHQAIHKASKVDGSGLTKVFDGKGTLYSLKVLHPSKQLEGYNVCGDDNGGCSHLCLPTSGHTFTCACPNDRNMSSDNFTCLNTDGTEVTTPRLTTSAPTSHLPFTVPQTNFPSTGSVVTTTRLTTSASTSHLPFTIPQTNFTNTTEFLPITDPTSTATTSSNICTMTPCKNGGICVVDRNSFKCYCRAPFIGKTCEEDLCTMNPCRNGGTCQVDGNSFKCDCRAPFLGKTCEEEENKNADATVGSPGNHGIIAVVIASVALFIAMVGMLIYNRHLLTRIVANAGNTNPVQKRNREENMYMEAPL